MYTVKDFRLHGRGIQFNSNEGRRGKFWYYFCDTFRVLIQYDVYSTSQQMIVRFRNLSLTAKLLLIGIIPLLFLTYFSVIIYREKSQKVELLGNYIKHIRQSQEIGELIAELTRERRYSFFYVLNDTGYSRVRQHRRNTDSILAILNKSTDLSLIDFPKYTFLDKLDSERIAVDSLKASTNDVMDYYTDAIFRLNQLSAPLPENTFLKSAFQDLVAQKKLSEMISYLGIIRTNVFNVLLTKKNAVETSLWTSGVYKVFNSYETEFILKASPEEVSTYERRKQETAYGSTLNYLDKVFSASGFDSTYSPQQFWQISTNAMITLRQQQRAIWKSAETKMQAIFHAEKTAKRQAISFMLFAILLDATFVVYVENQIHKALSEIQNAASKISVGATELRLKNLSKGIIGNLAKSIMDIDAYNISLAKAASEIGKGNFDINVIPRSEQDLLGFSIKKMQNDLQQFTAQKEKIQRDTEELVYRRDEFFSLASHELKTPVTSLKAYTQLLLMDAEGLEDTPHKKMLERMDLQINKLTSLINDLLDSSRIENGQLTFHKEIFMLNELVSTFVADMKPVSTGRKIIYENNNVDASVYGDRERIRQVLSNFMSNAIKYAPESKVITVSLKRSELNVVCSVQDFGKGISSEEHDKIFERFYRVSGPNLNTYPGLGLGLFICKEVIEKHEGKIGLDSEPGKGSIFYFELPVKSGSTAIPDVDENFQEPANE